MPARRRRRRSACARGVEHAAFRVEQVVDLHLEQRPHGGHLCRLLLQPASCVAPQNTQTQNSRPSRSRRQRSPHQARPPRPRPRSRWTPRHPPPSTSSHRHRSSRTAIDRPSVRFRHMTCMRLSTVRTGSDRWSCNPGWTAQCSASCERPNARLARQSLAQFGRGHASVPRDCPLRRDRTLRKGL